MKKSFKLLVCLLCGLCMLNTTPILAQDGPTDGSGVEQDPETRYFDYGAIAEDPTFQVVKNSGQRPSNLPMRRAAVTDQAWANYGIQQYWQDDWTNSICSGGSSIAQVGCTITSYSMVASKYGVYKNPEQMFYLLKQYGAIEANCNMTWNKTANQNALGLTFEHWNNTKHGNYTEAGGYQDIEGALKTGKPVIVGLQNVNNSNQKHYVVCYGFEKYSDGGKFHYIFNPQRGRPETIEGYMAQWYIRDITLLYN